MDLQIDLTEFILFVRVVIYVILIIVLYFCVASSREVFQAYAMEQCWNFMNSLKKFDIITFSILEWSYVCYVVIYI